MGWLIFPYPPVTFWLLGFRLEGNFSNSCSSFQIFVMSLSISCKVLSVLGLSGVAEAGRSGGEYLEDAEVADIVEGLDAVEADGLGGLPEDFVILVYVSTDEDRFVVVSELDFSSFSCKSNLTEFFGRPLELDRGCDESLKFDFDLSRPRAPDSSSKLLALLNVAFATPFCISLSLITKGTTFSLALALFL